MMSLLLWLSICCEQAGLGLALDPSVPAEVRNALISKYLIPYPHRFPPVKEIPDELRVSPEYRRALADHFSACKAYSSAAQFPDPTSPFAAVVLVARFFQPCEDISDQFLPFSFSEAREKMKDGLRTRMRRRGFWSDFEFRLHSEVWEFVKSDFKGPLNSSPEILDYVQAKIKQIWGGTLARLLYHQDGNAPRLRFASFEFRVWTEVHKQLVPNGEGLELDVEQLRRRVQNKMNRTKNEDLLEELKKSLGNLRLALDVEPGRQYGWDRLSNSIPETLGLPLSVLDVKFSHNIKIKVEQAIINSESQIPASFIHYALFHVRVCASISEIAHRTDADSPTSFAKVAALLSLLKERCHRLGGRRNSHPVITWEYVLTKLSVDLLLQIGEREISKENWSEEIRSSITAEPEFAEHVIRILRKCVDGLPGTDINIGHCIPISVLENKVFGIGGIWNRQVQEIESSKTGDSCKVRFERLVMSAFREFAQGQDSTFIQEAFINGFTDLKSLAQICHDDRDAIGILTQGNVLSSWGAAVDQLVIFSKGEVGHKSIGAQALILRKRVVEFSGWSGLLIFAYEALELSIYINRETLCSLASEPCAKFAEIRRNFRRFYGRGHPGLSILGDDVFDSVELIERVISFLSKLIEDPLLLEIILSTSFRPTDPREVAGRKTDPVFAAAVTFIFIGATMMIGFLIKNTITRRSFFCVNSWPS